ncbi:MAG: methyltransferase domain-containing protein [Xanthomonadales bacterium]|nr:methyltransferase domain-containing protein [Xanthomonadales bacterium]
MRRTHFDTLQPICPRCALDGRGQHKLYIASVFGEAGEIIVSGIIECADKACPMAYPIIDGVPIIVPNVAEYIASCQAQILQREPLNEDLRSLVSDAIGPNTEFDQMRQHLSIYCWGHYADLDPAEVPRQPQSAIATLLEDCAADTLPLSAPSIDLGCSVGRSSFELAATTTGMVLGVDLNFAMLRKAQKILIDRKLSYERRRIGIVYDRRAYPVELPNAELVDFWACDILALPFGGGLFNSALALNVFDCVNSPASFLAVLQGLLAGGGKAVIATPYDWTPGATPVENWIGGHSQRQELAGSAEAMLRRLLNEQSGSSATAELEIKHEVDAARWLTRLHDRSTVHYQAHAIVLQKKQAPTEGF